LFEEFFNSGSIDVIKGVDIAINLEKESIEYYNEKLDKMESSDAANLLKFIAREEVTHLKELEALRENLTKNRPWITADKLGKPHATEIYREKNLPAIREDSGDVGILLGAARAEEEARNFYEEFSKRIGDEKGKAFFMRLAEFEQTHYQLFSGILEASEVRVENAELP
jgi:rubrerythrin